MNPTQSPSTAVAIRPASSGFGLVMSPQTIEQAEKFCQMLAKTEFVPKAFRGKPDSIMVVGAMGARLGVDVFTAMSGIADINGKPCVYGDLMLAVCLNHPEFEDCLESVEGKAYEDTFTAVCTARRKGREPVTRSFSVIEAKEGGLWKKPGPWTTAPQRMLQMRARAFALRDTFADALAGMHGVEEMEGIVDVTDSVTVHADPKPARRRAALAVADPLNLSAGEQAQVEIDAEQKAEAKPEENKTLGEHVAEAPAEQKPKDLSVEKCVAEFSALWKHSDAGKTRAKAIQQTWRLEKIADLAGAAEGDREAFLAEVAEADAKLEG